MSLELLQQEMVKKGYPQISGLQADDEYHPFGLPCNGKGESGYYKIRQSASGLSAVYGDFVSGRKYRWTSGNNSKPSTPEEAEEIKKQLAKEAKEIEAKIKRKHEKGAMAANFFWNTGEQFKSHDYLDNKNVKSHGLKRCTLGDYAGWLMVPAYNDTGELVTVQYIDRDGLKRLETGGKKKDAYYELPGTGTKFILAEGYTTAASIHEATGHTVIVAFDAGNLVHVAKVIRNKYPDAEIVIAADNDQWKPEIGNTGVDAAKTAAIEIDAKLAIPQFKDTATQPTDYNDLVTLEGPEAVRAQMQAAAEVDKSEVIEAEIEKILQLDLLKQEIEIERLAKEYKIRKSKIDLYIRQKTGNRDDGKKIVEEIEPAENPVDGEKLLDTILSEISKRVVLPDGAAETISLWIMLTYCHNWFDTLAMLLITSPEKRCGKTTALEVLQAFVCKALPASNVTAAAVYRVIEQYSPTLLIDEADTFLNNKNNPDLAGVINCGHNRASAQVVKCDGDKNEVKAFSTWAPKAIGMIGMPRARTISDRSFVIQLSRKIPGEKIVKTGMRFIKQCGRIRSMCRRWADDNAERIKTCCESLPSSDNDRADDNWAPLFTIASVIGGTWLERVKTARALIDKSSDDDGIGTQLLSDIRDIFEEQSAERIFSSDLIEKLKELSDSPWSDWNNGRGLSTNGLSRRLKPFGVQPKTMRIDSDRYKGYTLKSFKDVFNRYIPYTPTVTPCQSNDFNSLDEKPTVTPNNDVTDENYDNHLNLYNCHDVTDEKEVNHGNKGFDLDKTKNGKQARYER